MTKEEIYRYLYTNSASFSMSDIVRAMLEGLLIAIIIYVTYYLTYKGVAYNKKFNGTLVVVSLISCVIMLMISSNIIISLGMVGALSIVRFRTAIKDSRDTAFIFWAISEGLCVGSENMRLASVTTIFISAVILALNYVPSMGEKYLLVIRTDEKIQDISEIEDNVKSIAKHIKIRALNQGKTGKELIYEIKGKCDMSRVKSLADIDGINAVNCIIETGEEVG